MVMLKKKREVNYRKGTTGQHCAVCDHFECAFQVRSCNGRPLALAPRCAVIGLENGRAYRIGEKNLCDRFDNSKRLAAIMGAHDDQGDL